MSDYEQLINSLLYKEIPHAKILSQESGSIYGFRVELEGRISWLYLDRTFFDDNSPTEIINLFNIHRVTEALQDEMQPQKLYFDGFKLSEYSS